MKACGEDIETVNQFVPYCPVFVRLRTQNFEDHVISDITRLRGVD